jgi:zinc transporter
MLDLDQNSGLICGYDIGPEGLIKGLDAQRMAAALSSPHGTVWLHFSLADMRARAFIAGCDLLSEDVREILLDESEHVGLERFGDGLAGVLGDLHHEFRNDPRALGSLRVYAERHRVITARRHPLMAVDQVRRSIAAGMPVLNGLELILLFIHSLTTTLTTVVNDAADTVDDVEDRLLIQRIGDEGSALGQVRRLTARLRRQIVAQRNALAQLSKRLPIWCGDDDRTALGDAVERLSDLVHDIELIQERARLLQEELSARLTEATNRNLYVLSIATVIMLPVTLVTGVFGMNVAGLPWVQDTDGFTLVMLVMALVAGASVAALKWLKLF